MDLELFPEYLASIKALRERYRGQIDIYLGVEAEYYPQYHNWLKEQRDSGTLDYVILGSHFDEPNEPLYFGSNLSKKELYRYANHTIKGMQTGLFCALAHPELFMISLNKFDEDCLAISRDIVRAAKQAMDKYLP